MAGLLYTDRGGPVPCCKAASATTIADLIEELRYSQGQRGSVNITTASHNVVVGWYNYLYIPHRIGGTASDNMNYGNLFLMSLTTNAAYIYNIRFNNTTIQNAQIYRSTGMTPSTTCQSVSFTTNITAYSSSWQTCLNNWSAPSNGYLKIYFQGNTTPAAYIKDNTNTFEVRDNGNGSRDYAVWIPCTAGHTYTAGCVYSKTSSAYFYPSTA